MEYSYSLARIKKFGWKLEPRHLVGFILKRNCIVVVALEFLNFDISNI